MNKPSQFNPLFPFVIVAALFAAAFWVSSVPFADAEDPPNAAPQADAQKQVEELLRERLELLKLIELEDEADEDDRDEGDDRNRDEGNRAELIREFRQLQEAIRRHARAFENQPAREHEPGHDDRDRERENAREHEHERGHEAEHEREHGHEQGHAQEHEHERGHAQEHEHERGHEAEHEHGHERGHEQGHAHEHEHERGHAQEHERELDRRIHHLHQAIEQLHAGGFRDLAEEVQRAGERAVAQQQEQLEREHHRHHGPHDPHGDHEREGDHDEGHRRHHEELERAVHRIERRLDQLTEAIENLRGE